MDLVAESTKNMFLMAICMILKNVISDVKEEHEYKKATYMQVPGEEWVTVSTCPVNTSQKM